jgi:hypothetical protein
MPHRPEDSLDTHGYSISLTNNKNSRAKSNEACKSVPTDSTDKLFNGGIFEVPEAPSAVHPDTYQPHQDQKLVLRCQPTIFKLTTSEQPNRKHGNVNVFLAVKISRVQ